MSLCVAHMELGDAIHPHPDRKTMREGWTMTSQDFVTLGPGKSASPLLCTSFESDLLIGPWGCWPPFRFWAKCLQCD